jgi:hypothetical protein
MTRMATKEEWAEIRRETRALWKERIREENREANFQRGIERERERLDRMAREKRRKAEVEEVNHRVRPAKRDRAIMTIGESVWKKTVSPRGVFRATIDIGVFELNMMRTRREKWDYYIIMLAGPTWVGSEIATVPRSWPVARVLNGLKVIDDKIGVRFRAK